MTKLYSSMALTKRPAPNGCEIAKRADFSRIRYAQCWEDADVLLKGLDIKPGEICLSVASAGDNTLSLLSASPAKVIAVDLNPQQIACLELRASAFKIFTYEEVLRFLGVTDGERAALYIRLRPHLSLSTRNFFDRHRVEVMRGIGHAGKFERYFEIFRNSALPFVHSPATIEELLTKKTEDERKQFFDEKWNTPKWRTLFRMFFSKKLMGLLGRDPSFFRYVDVDVAEAILARTEHAITMLDPSINPYMQWILKGKFETALPHYLRRENFEAIKKNIDRLELRMGTIESVLEEVSIDSIDKFNLSDIFEYMSVENYQQLLVSLIRAGKSGGRLVYWNMLAPRSRPERMAPVLKPLTALAAQLHKEDKAFFYSKVVVEEIMC